MKLEIFFTFLMSWVSGNSSLSTNLIEKHISLSKRFYLSQKIYLIKNTDSMRVNLSNVATYYPCLIVYNNFSKRLLRFIFNVKLETGQD